MKKSQKTFKEKTNLILYLSKTQYFVVFFSLKNCLFTILILLMSRISVIYSFYPQKQNKIKNRMISEKPLTMRYLLIGAPNRIRTCDPLITNEMLYQLSYRSNINIYAGMPRTTSLCFAKLFSSLCSSCSCHFCFSTALSSLFSTVDTGLFNHLGQL